jgi:hypothetical protein
VREESGVALMRMEKRLEPFMTSGLTDEELIEALFRLDVRPKVMNE